MMSAPAGTSNVNDHDDVSGRPVIPLLNTIGASTVSEQPSSKSERHSLKQRHLTPQDVSMPELTAAVYRCI